ncbi:MAG: hypothetical protein JW809_17255 [Pirellulales bacterium]|nr:hypothetical protein [Pirellulales bacterium]
MNRQLSSLIRVARWAFWGCIFFLVVGLVVRLLWRAAHLETGFSTLQCQWRDATVGWIVGDRNPIPSREPAEQAEFWLREVDRILEDRPDDAALAIGAALVLDAPSIDFMSRYMKARPGPVPGGIIIDTDDDAVKTANNAFEQACKDRCLALAARAVQLDPANAQWWRLRALLLRSGALSSADDAPRTSDWLAVLDECARHEPDNALYDYLAALAYWNTSAEVDFSGPADRLIVKDAQTFDKGIRRFEQGQTKPHFSVGDVGFTATAQFLVRTRVPLVEQASVVNCRPLLLRRSQLLYGVWRWQHRRAEREAATGNLDAAMELNQQNLRLIAQCESGDEGGRYDATAIASKIATACQRRELAEMPGSGLGDSEKKAIAASVEEAILHRDAVQLAGQALAAGASGPAAPGLPLVGANLAVAFFMDLMPAFVVLLLLTGVVSAILARWSGDAESSTVGFLGWTSTLALAAAATIVFLGLAPAEIIGRKVQAWFFTIALCGMALCVVVWIRWHWLRRRAFQFSIRAMLIVTLIVALCMSLIVMMSLPGEVFARFPFPMSVPARGWQGIDPSVYGNVFAPNLGPWFLPALQWTAYHGPAWTLVLWAVMLIALHVRAARRRRCRMESPLPNRQARWLGPFRSLRQPALVTAILLLIAHLALAPGVLKATDASIQNAMAFARHPESHWRKVKKAVDDVLAEKALMSQRQKTAPSRAADERRTDDNKKTDQPDGRE